MPGLIPQAFIDELLHRVDIVDVVGRRVGLKKVGANHSACCPFHNEKTPSFKVRQDKQFYHCFGCGVGGNAIDFIMRFERAEFPQAVEILARDVGLEVPREQSPAATRRRAESNRLLEVLERASKFYQQQLRSHPDRRTAIDYLKARQLGGKVAARFGLGYAPPGWDNLLTALGTDEQQQQLLLKAGLIIAREHSRTRDGASTSGHYDRFRHRIIFPIRDVRGRTIAFGGRVLGDDQPKYLNSPETPVFRKGAELYGLYEARKSAAADKRMLLAEGYTDVIALAQAGIDNVVATLGTATSDKHLERLFRQAPELVFCFDGDAAGRKAAWRALETTLPLMQDGRQVRFLFLPEGADPDSRVREVGREQFLQEVEGATPLEQVFFEQLTRDLDADSIEGKARLRKLAEPLVRRIPHGVYGRLMLDRLAGILGMDTKELDRLSTAQPPDDGPVRPPPPPTAYAHDRQASGRGNHPGSRTPARKSASIKAIELLLQRPQVALGDTDLEPLRTAKDKGERLLVALIEMVRANPDTGPLTLAGFCQGAGLAGWPPQQTDEERITPEEGIKEEFDEILDRMLSRRRQQAESEKIKATLKARVTGASDDGN